MFNFKTGHEGFATPSNPSAQGGPPRSHKGGHSHARQPISYSSAGNGDGVRFEYPMSPSGAFLAAAPENLELPGNQGLPAAPPAQILPFDGSAPAFVLAGQGQLPAQTHSQFRSNNNPGLERGVDQSGPSAQAVPPASNQSLHDVSFAPQQTLEASQLNLDAGPSGYLEAGRLHELEGANATPQTTASQPSHDNLPANVSVFHGTWFDENQQHENAGQNATATEAPEQSFRIDNAPFQQDSVTVQNDSDVQPRTTSYLVPEEVANLMPPSNINALLTATHGPDRSLIAHTVEQPTVATIRLIPTQEPEHQQVDLADAHSEGSAEFPTADNGEPARPPSYQEILSAIQTIQSTRGIAVQWKGSPSVSPAGRLLELPAEPYPMLSEGSDSSYRNHLFSKQFDSTPGINQWTRKITTNEAKEVLRRLIYLFPGLDGRDKNTNIPSMLQLAYRFNDSLYGELIEEKESTNLPPPPAETVKRKRGRPRKPRPSSGRLASEDREVITDTRFGRVRGRYSIREYLTLVHLRSFRGDVPFFIVGSVVDHYLYDLGIDVIKVLDSRGVPAN
ncbi:hypothetical protein KEM54_006326 [Ascosphaera aggregata]|nr:hypothetical protein KEM54_006326 [Ascosphaera aggregata]